MHIFFYNEVFLFLTQRLPSNQFECSKSFCQAKDRLFLFLPSFSLFLSSFLPSFFPPPPLPFLSFSLFLPLCCSVSCHWSTGIDRNSSFPHKPVSLFLSIATRKYFCVYNQNGLCWGVCSFLRKIPANYCSLWNNLYAFRHLTKLTLDFISYISWNHFLLV